MADDVKAAPALDTTKVEQDVSWIGARLREKSTYAGLLVLLSLVAPHLTDPSALVSALSMIGMGVGALIAIILPEKTVAKVAAVVVLAILAGSLLFAPAPAFAFNTPTKATGLRLKTLSAAPSSTATTSSGALTPAQVQQNPFVLLQNITTADLNAALADANAQTPPDTVGANCYTALIALKTNPAFALPSGSVPGVFTAVQKARDLQTQLANIVSPTGPLATLNAACAAWTQSNIATLIAIGGAVGLVANPAGASAAVATLPAAIATFLAAIPK